MRVFNWLSAVILVAMASSLRAQVLAVNVGVTPACPYGLAACWGGAEQGLSRLTGVDSVGRKPDAVNSLGEVHLKSTSLPDIELWAKQFKSIVGQVYAFRGVEVTIRGKVQQTAGGNLVLQIDGMKNPVPLVAFSHKLQWNFREHQPWAIRSEEAAALKLLSAAIDGRGDHTAIVKLSGPLIESGNDHHLAIEVRQYKFDEGKPADGSATTKPTAGQA